MKRSMQRFREQNYESSAYEESAARGRRAAWTLAGLVVVFLAVLGGLLWANYRFAANTPGGSDFLPRWVGTRFFIKQGWSPYSEETSEEIHLLAFGRARPPRGVEPVRFVYPFYSVLIFAPFAISSDWVAARALWMTVAEIGVLAIVAMGIALIQWRPSRFMFLVLALFSMLWFHSVKPVLSGDPAVLAAVMITGALLAIRSEHDVLGGFLLGLATFKPQMVVLLVVFLLVWSASRGRWVLFSSFLATVAFLMGATSLLLRESWFMDGLREMVLHVLAETGGSPGALFVRYFPGIGREMGWVLTVFMLGTLFWEWRKALGQEFRWFLWAASLTLVLTNLSGVYTSTDNYIAMLPVLILVLGTWVERWGTPGRWLAGGSLVVLFFGLWAMAWSAANRGFPFDLRPEIFFLLPVFLLVGLYWVRWWFTRPPRLPLETFVERVG